MVAETPGTAVITRPWPVAVLLGAAFFLVLFDSLAVATALPALGADLGLTTSSLPWVVNLYSLGLGGLMLLAGPACDRWGRRRVFLAGLAVLTTASILAGVAQEPVLLLMGRALQGMAAAFILPTALAMTGTFFPQEPWRSRAFSVVLVSGATSGVAGALGGGLLTAVWGWRWVFLATVPPALLILTAAGVLLPPDQSRHSGSGRPDLLGAVLSTAGISVLLLGIGEAQRAGPASAQTLVTICTGLALLAAFARWQRHAARPLLRPGLLRSRRLVGACLGSAAHSAVYSAGIVVGSLHLQDAYGFSAATAGLALAPTLLATTVSGTVAARLVRRFGSRRVAGAALVLAASSLFLLAVNATLVGYLTAVLPWLLLRGLAEGADYVALTRAAVADATEGDRGAASSVFEATTHIGGAVSVAVYAALIASGAGYSAAYTAGAVFALAGAVAVFLLLPHNGPERKDGKQTAGHA